MIELIVTDAPDGSTNVSPGDTGVPLMAVTVSVSPVSGSVERVSGERVRLLSSLTLGFKSTAIGASFWPVIVIVTDAALVPPFWSVNT